MKKFRRPLGLVLAGGGAHGAWQAAALDHLDRKFQLDISHILSFSIGSMTGAGYCLCRLPKLVSIWKNISAHRILRFRPNLLPFSAYSARPLWEVLRHAGSEAEAKRKFRCTLTSISLCVETQKHVYSRFTPEGRDGWDGPLGEWMMASCAIPQVFPPVRIHGRGEGFNYVDGGCQGDEPFNFGTLKDCKDIIVMQMTRPDDIGRRPSFGVFSDRMQRVRDGIHHVISTGLEPLKALAEPPRIYRFYPSVTLDYSYLGFESRYTIPALFQGYHDAEEFMKDAEAFRE